VIESLRRSAGFTSRAASIIEQYEEKLRAHRLFIEREGVDPPEIQEWRW
jgi:phosphoketolase